jgi:hypothetical protein
LNDYYKENRMWNGRKQSVAHGNRCMCNSEKISERVSRRRTLDKFLEEGIEDYILEETIWD